MYRHTHANGVITYTFESLTDLPVKAHVSTRHGGVSPEPWRSLNLSIARGDSRERVETNRDRLTAAIGVDSNQLVRCRQVHGTGVAKVDASDANSWLDGTDGLVTDTRKLPLLLLFADCTPILLFDPVQRALGVCHPRNRRRSRHGKAGAPRDHGDRCTDRRSERDVDRGAWGAMNPATAVIF